MARVTPFNVTRDDFSGGERGLLDPATPGAWKGLNVVALTDGSIAPRSGLAPLEVQSLPNGRISGMGWADGGAGADDKVWVVIDDDVYLFSPVQGATADQATGALDTAPTAVVDSYHEAGVVYLLSRGDKVYKLTLDGSTVAAVSNTDDSVIDPGRSIVAWNGFLIAGGGDNDPSVMWWSDGDTYDGWPSNPNFQQIGGAGSAIVGLFVIRNQLVVAKDDGTWWVVSGDLSTSSFPDAIYSVRQIAQTFMPLREPQAGAAIGGQQVWYVGKDAPWPSWFNGSLPDDLDYLLSDWTVSPNTTDPIAPRLTVCRIAGPEELLIAAGASGTDLLMFRNGAWSRHRLAVQGLPWVAPMDGGRILFCDGGADDAPPAFYVWQASLLQRPPSDTFPEAVDDDGEPFDAEFEVEFYTDEGKQARVRSVAVEFERYEHPDGQKIGCELTMTRRADAGADVTETATAWEGDGDETGMARHVFRFSLNASGAGVRVKLNELAGVRIERVSVHGALAWEDNQ